MQLQSFRRLNIGDFSPDQQALVEKLAVSLNVGIENLYIAASNNLTFSDNFSGTQKTLSFSVDAKGNPTSTISFPLNTANNATPKIIGTEVLNAVNSTNSATYPTGAPFISWTQNNNNIIINNITGLTASDTWSITVFVFH